MMPLPDTLIILMSWAAHLSGYPMPERENMPVVSYQPPAFFVENVCGGHECSVQGWYNDQGVVYISNELWIDSGYESSVIVHEFIHYLQDISELYDTESCDDALFREREAYGVQNAYFVEALARFQRIQPGPTRCAK